MKITCPVCGNETEQPRCEQCGYAICSDVMADIVNTRDQRTLAEPRADEKALRTELQAPEKAAADLPEQGKAFLTALKTVGRIVKYGQYPQDADGTKKPIEWIVMAYDAEKNQATLLSRYGLEARQYQHEELYPSWQMSDILRWLEDGEYHDGTPYPTWEKSDIRAWLNGEFLNAAFSAEEQKRIVTAKLSTPGSRGGSGGKDTEDKVWLLSREEAEKYFKGYKKRRTAPTAYAIANGADESSHYKTIAYMPKGKGCCGWWLRSPGYDSYDASCVCNDGSIFSYAVENAALVVRPALILDLNSLVMALPPEKAAADLPELGEACLTALKTVGSIVQYGQYPQDADGTKRPIEWIVLAYDAEKNQATLLSRYGLEAKPYHHETPYPTWEKSDIRAWLNGEFLNAAFSAEERKRIAETVIHTEDNREWESYCKKNCWKYEKVSGGNDCRDRIFLLSLEEAMAYAGHANLVGFYLTGSEKMKTTATDYANEHGADEARNGCCWWWLRSPSRYGNCASCVPYDGSLNYNYVDDTDGVARPAFILNLGSL